MTPKELKEVLLEKDFVDAVTVEVEGEQRGRVALIVYVIADMVEGRDGREIYDEIESEVPLNVGVDISVHKM